MSVAVMAVCARKVSDEGQRERCFCVRSSGGGSEGERVWWVVTRPDHWTGSESSGSLTPLIQITRVPWVSTSWKKSIVSTADLTFIDTWTLIDTCLYYWCINVLNLTLFRLASALYHFQRVQMWNNNNVKRLLTWKMLFPVGYFWYFFHLNIQKWHKSHFLVLVGRTAVGLLVRIPEVRHRLCWRVGQLIFSV